MDFQLGARCQDLQERLQEFMRDEVIPHEADYRAQLRNLNSGSDWKTWQVVPMMEDWKSKARDAGLWNLFLPDDKLALGLSTLEYAPLAETMGRYPFSAEIFNCSAPDTGNMEVLWHFGSDAQKQEWLTPLLAGEIRSVFCMTEPLSLIHI